MIKIGIGVRFPKNLKLNEETLESISLIDKRLKVKNGWLYIPVDDSYFKFGNIIDVLDEGLEKVAKNEAEILGKGNEKILETWMKENQKENSDVENLPEDMKLDIEWMILE